MIGTDNYNVSHQVLVFYSKICIYVVFVRIVYTKYIYIAGSILQHKHMSSKQNKNKNTFTLVYIHIYIHIYICTGMQWVGILVEY